MTYEELIEMCKQGDPLIDPERPNAFFLLPDEDCLVLPGRCDKGHWQLDVKIRIEGNGFRVWVRDPIDELEKTVGTDWSYERFFTEYSDLVTWVYSW